MTQLQRDQNKCTCEDSEPVKEPPLVMNVVFWEPFSVLPCYVKISKCSKYPHFRPNKRLPATPNYFPFSVFIITSYSTTSSTSHTVTHLPTSIYRPPSARDQQNAVPVSSTTIPQPPVVDSFPHTAPLFTPHPPPPPQSSETTQ